MRLSNKIVEDVVSEVAGDDVLPLVRALKNKKNVSEFKLAESIKEEVNTTRNMLYRLYDSNLVSFVRKKDKKKGWYIYYWTFDSKKIKHLLTNLKKKRLLKLKDRLEREKANHFYSCKSKCIRLDFDQSMEFEFKCPECGELIEQEDNSEEIQKIETEIKELEEEFKEKNK
jgi:transcription initiation factor TFIIE subunit alpha